MPTFARPIPVPVAQPAAASSTLSPAMTFVSLATLSCAALFLFARPDGAQNLPASKSGATAHKQADAVAKTAATEETAASGSADRQDLSFYTSNVRDAMFSAPVPPAPVAPPVAPKAPKRPEIPLPPIKINPFADWNYTGTVHMGDSTIALLENWRTGEGKYVKVGDDFIGSDFKSSKITSITDQDISIAPADKAIKPEKLAKGDAIVVTPLNFDAPGKNPQQQQVQNGQQNAQGAVAAATAPSQPVVMGRNGQPITDPAQAQRFQQRLDQRFNGGGGGGRRGGGNRGAFGGGG